MSPVPRSWALDWSVASIALSLVGAVLRLMGGALFLIGMIVFVLGLIAGLVALRQGRRRSLAIGGIALNVVNLVLDAGFVISASSR